MSKDGAVLCQGLTGEQADRVVLLLLAMGIEPALEPGERVSIRVAPDQVDRARTLLHEEFPYGFDQRGDLDPRKRRRPRFLDPVVSAPQGWFGRGTGAIVGVMVVCAALFALAHVGPDAGSRSRLLELGAISWQHVERGEHWRLITAMFIHFNLAHLATNMLTLTIVGPPLAHMVGASRFVLIFAVAGLGGNILSHELSPIVGLKAGASGAIAGVIGALCGQALRPGRESRFRSWHVIGAMAAFYGMLIGFGPGRDNLAHFGGLLTGAVMGWLIEPLPGERRPDAPREAPRPTA